MLSKRTNILFDEILWKKLTAIAKAEHSSVGKLVRDAVEEKYASQKEFEKRREVFNKIIQHRPAPQKGKIDYKALINAGRKY